MRPWPEELKRSLRHLAAARYCGQHADDAFQDLFWSELLLAAESMGLSENATRYRQRLERSA